jgi:hypothetical protein
MGELYQILRRKRFHRKGTKLTKYTKKKRVHRRGTEEEEKSFLGRREEGSAHARQRTQGVCGEPSSLFPSEGFLTFGRF